MIASISEQFIKIFGDYPFLEIIFLSNKVINYFTFILVFLLIYSFLRVFRVFILKKIKRIIKKIGRDFGDLLVSVLDSIKTPFYWFLSFYASVNVLNLNPSLSRFINAILLVWVAYQIIKAIEIFVDYGLNLFSGKNKEDKETQDILSVIGKIIKGAVWAFMGLLVLSNLGINVTSLMAGLGVGGLAVAFALQNILTDLFSSFSIYFDKPFVVGDFIIVGEHMGTIEKIGIKTTRLKALQGEEIVISNTELTTARIQNFKKMKKRRIVFGLGVVYDTPLEKLKKINSIISETIKKQKLAELDRVHFSKFNNFSLDFEIVYYILSGNYSEYMEVHQNILFEIKKKFEESNISMAFPTQTLHIEKLKEDK